MPLAEIVSRSGLSERTYLRTARKDSWATVKFEVIERFLNGCNVNPWKMRDHYRFLKVHQFKIPYLTKKQQQIMDDICAQQLK